MSQQAISEVDNSQSRIPSDATPTRKNGKGQDMNYLAPSREQPAQFSDYLELPKADATKEKGPLQKSAQSNYFQQQASIPGKPSIHLQEFEKNLCKHPKISIATIVMLKARINKMKLTHKEKKHYFQNEINKIVEPKKMIDLSKCSFKELVAISRRLQSPPKQSFGPRYMEETRNLSRKTHKMASKIDTVKTIQEIKNMNPALIDLDNLNQVSKNPPETEYTEYGPREAPYTKPIYQRYMHPSIPTAPQAKIRDIVLDNKALLKSKYKIPNPVANNDNMMRTQSWIEEDKDENPFRYRLNSTFINQHCSEPDITFNTQEFTEASPEKSQKFCQTDTGFMPSKKPPSSQKKHRRTGSLPTSFMDSKEAEKVSQLSNMATDHFLLNRNFDYSTFSYGTVMVGHNPRIESSVLTNLTRRKLRIKNSQAPNLENFERRSNSVYRQYRRASSSPTSAQHTQTIWGKVSTGGIHPTPQLTPDEDQLSYLKLKIKQMKETPSNNSLLTATSKNSYVQRKPKKFSPYAVIPKLK